MTTMKYWLGWLGYLLFYRHPMKTPAAEHGAMDIPRFQPNHGRGVDTYYDTLLEILGRSGTV